MMTAFKSALVIAALSGSLFAAEPPGTYFNPAPGTGNVTSGNEIPEDGRVKRTIAFLGGSITEMDGFRPLVMKSLRENHPEIAFVEIAAGLGSTCSDAAALRFSQDVLAKGVPDLMVVEEAVNDDQDGHFDRLQMIQGMEGVIRQARRANPRCVVVVALMVNAEQFRQLSEGKTPFTYAVHREVAAHYGAEIADVGTALAESARSGGLGWNEYRDCHPSPEGCALGAKVVTAAIERNFESMLKPQERPLPSPMDFGSLACPKAIDLKALKTGKGWQVAKPEWSKVAGSKRDYFTHGDVLWTDSPRSETEIPFEGSGLLAFVTAGPDCGKVEVSVDEGPFRLLTPRAFYGDLHYPHVLRLAQDCRPGRHIARVRCVSWKRKDGKAGGALRLHRLWSEGNADTLITDIAACAGATNWRAMAYETKDGVKGTLLYAPWGLEKPQTVKIPLPLNGRYRVFLGLGGTRLPLAGTPFAALVRLARDPAPVRIDSPAESPDAGWWFQPVEVEWKTADLSNDVLVVDRPHNSRTMLAWVRLEPVEEGPRMSPVKRFVVTNDAYHPYENMDELCAPFMRFADSSVRAVSYCVGNGPFAFASASWIAFDGLSGEGACFENLYASECAKTYAWLHRDHPHLVDELADLAHKIGLEFYVAFRTGCALDCMRLSDPLNRAGANGSGLFKDGNFCRLWDGTPVARLSYASEEVQDFFLRFYAEQLTKKVDGIHIIWIRALPAMLFEQHFRDRFRQEYGEDVAREDDPRIIALRKEIMTGFLARVRKVAGRKRVLLVVPATGELCESFGLDVVRLAREGLVDEFHIGDSLQTARHAESFDSIDFAYFRRALEGTSASYMPFLWCCDGAAVKKGLKQGAAGALLWDVGDKPWCHWKAFDGGGGMPTVHPFRMLDGFDAAKYPWHLAY